MSSFLRQFLKTRTNWFLSLTIHQLKMVNRQIRFCPGGLSSNESHDYVRFLFVQLDGVKTLHLALQRPVSYVPFVYHFIRAVCLSNNWRRKLQYLPARADGTLFKWRNRPGTPLQFASFKNNVGLRRNKCHTSLVPITSLYPVNNYNSNQIM